MAKKSKYQKFDQDFKQGAVQLVFETGKPIAQVARELGRGRGGRQGGKAPAWARVARVVRSAATKLTRSGSCPACSAAWAISVRIA